ncbi:MAG: MFS transporter [Lautropia sp.]
MTVAERAASVWLALLVGTRTLGMFLILPVFAVHAASMPGGADLALVGLAIGVYGLTQACLQIPFGVASDRFGRKPVITAGLLVMVVGCLVAGFARNVEVLAVGRALQGAGAVSAAVSALLADCTRDQQRTKAMAFVGGAVAVSFAVSLVASPLLYRVVGLSGIFFLIAALVAGAIVVLWTQVPDPPPLRASDQAGPRVAGEVAASSAPSGEAASGEAASGEAASGVASVGGVGGGASGGYGTAGVFVPDLLRLDFGVFCLHLVQMALFVVVPGRLVAHAGLPLAEHWKVYLPVVLLSFVLMMPPLMRAERKGRLKALFLAGIATVAASLAGFALLPPTLLAIAVMLLLFFFGFNLLEASLPSLVSRLAPRANRGLALGVYNTAQALGIFLGGLAGGVLLREGGAAAVFGAGFALMLVWLAVARGATRWPGRPARAGSAAPSA